MSISIAIGPYAEPVHLTEARVHLKQTGEGLDDDDAENDLILGLISAARDQVETATSGNLKRMQTMLASTFEETFNGFPCYFQLERTPIISIDSITYVDNSGDTQTLDSSKYVLTAEKGLVELAYSQIWPSTRWQPNAVTVRYKAGIAASFTAVAATDIFTVSGRILANGDRVRVKNSGGILPDGLTENRDYFVINVSGSTFQLSKSLAGSPVDIISAGSGTHFVGTELTRFESLRSAVKLVLTRLYYGRGDSEAQDTNGIGYRNAQSAIEALIASGT